MCLFAHAPTHARAYVRTCARIHLHACVCVCVGIKDVRTLLLAYDFSLDLCYFVCVRKVRLHRRRLAVNPVIQLTYLSINWPINCFIIASSAIYNPERDGGYR